jgi:hypothetical protein
MAIDLGRTVRQLAEAALREAAQPEPTEAKKPKKPLLSTGRAMLLGAGLMTAGRALASSRGRHMLGSVQEFLEEHRDSPDGEEPEDFEDEEPQDFQGEEPEAEGDKEPEAESDEDFDDEDLEDDAEVEDEEEPEAEAEDEPEAEPEDDEPEAEEPEAPRRKPRRRSASRGRS